MRQQPVEIYDDRTNTPVLRHPERRFPGVLIQGDTLHALCARADAACAGLASQRGSDAWAELNDLRNALRDLLTHYKVVLGEHDLPLPFSEDIRP